MIRGVVGVFAAPRAIIFDPLERTIRFTKAERRGKVWQLPGGRTILAPEQVWHRENWYGAMDVRYILVAGESSFPLKAEVRDAEVVRQSDSDGPGNQLVDVVIDPTRLVQEELDNKLFSAALHSKIATNFLRGGMDWKILVIVALVIAVIALAVRA